MSPDSPAAAADGGPIRFAVVIPSLNSGRFIGAAVTSALSQVPPPHEVIVQDGGSTDQTLAVLEQFGNQIALVSEPDRGQADALNRAIARATGNTIVWLNADDELAPGAFAAVSSALGTTPEAEFAFGNFEVIDSAGKSLRLFESAPYDPRRVFWHGCYIFSGAMFFRRTLLDRTGAFDDRFQTCMDLDYLMRIGPARAANLHQVVARFRASSDQKSATMPWTFLRESHAIRWRAAGNSVPLKMATFALGLRDLGYLLTHRLRFSRTWSAFRRYRRI